MTYPELEAKLFSPPAGLALKYDLYIHHSVTGPSSQLPNRAGRPYRSRLHGCANTGMKARASLTN